jgi:N-acyl-D-amino-acid deacylase
LLDLLINNGLIVDGTGNPGFYGSVGVEGETVHVFRGDLAGIEAARIIDAKSKVVCPGFIDMHAHSGLVILAEPEHHPKVRQGITTELVGVDGNSYAPFTSHEDFVSFVELNSGLDGAPRLPGRWSTVAEYLSMFDNKSAVNIAYIIGNSPLRIGTVGWHDRPANEVELANMRAVLREGMEEGAFGLSTGLDYPPGSYAGTAELVELAREAARLGGIYHTHLRNALGDSFLDPVREALDIGQSGEIPCHLTHFYRRITHPGSARQLLDLVDSAVGQGQDVTMDCYPYTYSSTRLLILFPQWAHDGGPLKLKEVLRSSEGRERLRREIRPRGGSFNELWLTYFKRPHNRKYEGRSVAEVAEIMGMGEVDAMCDLLLDEDLQISYVTPGPNLPTLPDFITHPRSMVGTDGLLVGDYPSPRTYGTFPTILAEYVRDERSITLEEAIRKMTSMAALRLDIRDRGMLRDGMKADIVVFDPKTVKSPATRHEPKQFPVGIDYVLVNGSIVVDRGQHTGVLAGRALRHGRAST